MNTACKMYAKMAIACVLIAGMPITYTSFDIKQTKLRYRFFVKNLDFERFHNIQYYEMLIFPGLRPGSPHFHPEMLGGRGWSFRCRLILYSIQSICSYQ